MSSAKDLLQGKPFKSPLHPALVHLPLALFPLSFLMDLASRIYPHPEYQLVRAAFVAICAGLATAVIAAIVGIIDYVDIRDDNPAKKTATLHMVLNLVAVGLFGLGAGLRANDLTAAETATFPLIVSLVALGLLGYSGYLGGDLVYNHGIGVGRHHRYTKTPESTILIPTVGAESVPVASEAELKEGETLRVSVGATIIAVARVEGKVYAFQEFCTHRYAPLSEGSFKGCEVICPWHGSRFDVRTGRVTSGPAKGDLRTFEVQSREGKIWVRLPPQTAAGRSA